MANDRTAPKTTAAYRDHDAPIRLRVAELREQRRDALARLSPAYAHLHARRVARTLAGAVATAGGALTFVVALLGTLILPRSSSGPPTQGLATTMLLASWIAAAGTYGVARLAASGRLRRSLAAEERSTDDAHAELARLEAQSAANLAEERVEAQEVRSVALPLMGIGMLAPLTLHLIIYALLASSSSSTSLEGFFSDFDAWIVASAVLTSHCHALLAHGAWRFAKAARGAETELLATVTPGPANALYRVFLGSLVTSAVFMGIGTFAMRPIDGLGISLMASFALLVIVGITGGAFVPYTFGRMRQLLRNEREQLEEASREARAKEEQARAAPVTEEAAPTDTAAAREEAQAEEEAEALSADTREESRSRRARSSAR